jgi:hypothetical protein
MAFHVSVSHFFSSTLIMMMHTLLLTILRNTHVSTGDCDEVRCATTCLSVTHPNIALSTKILFHWGSFRRNFQMYAPLISIFVGLTHSGIQIKMVNIKSMICLDEA